MMSPRAQAVKLAIQHVREPRQRTPIAAGTPGESPADPLHAQPLGHFRVLPHVYIVVVVDEPVPNRLPKNQSDRQQKQTTNATTGDKVCRTD